MQKIWLPPLVSKYLKLDTFNGTIKTAFQETVAYNIYKFNLIAIFNILCQVHAQLCVYSSLCMCMYICLYLLNLLRINDMFLCMLQHNLTVGEQFQEITERAGILLSRTLPTDSANIITEKFTYNNISKLHKEWRKLC